MSEARSARPAEARGDLRPPRATESARVADGGTEPLARLVELACLLEVAARKVGNVHPLAAFCDTTCADFVASAHAIAPVVARAEEQGVGRTILAAVRATRDAVGRNTNLGIVLLLTPLAAVPRGTSLRAGIVEVLAGTTIEDAELAYEAIRLAAPGGLGKAESADVFERPAVTLLEAMRLAAGRDDVAAQYATGFARVLDAIAPALAETPDFAHAWESTILKVQLRQLAREPDTLIARKCGASTAEECRVRAERVVERLQDLPVEAWWSSAACREFDAWLRADGHRRNPGTTADLIAAGLFAALREGTIAPPPRAVLDERFGRGGCAGHVDPSSA